jgi:GNAT superfamily N-acetyltransferase
VVALSRVDCTDLNMAAVWGDLSQEAVSALREWSGPILLLASDGAYRECAERAESLGLADLDTALPVWSVEIDPQRLPPALDSGLVSVVTTRADLARVRRIIALSYGLDSSWVDEAFPDELLESGDITWYLSWSDGEAVSTIALVRVGTDVSGWCGATLPHARGNGLFTALVLETARLQAEAGARRFLGITEAVASGRTAVRFGGVEVDRAHVFIRGTSVGELLQG